MIFEPRPMFCLSLGQDLLAASQQTSSLNVCRDKPDPNLLLRIAGRMNTDFDCSQLAVSLGVETDFITKTQQLLKNPKSIAFEVLREWSRGDNGSSLALYTALNVEDFQQIATEFKKDLLSAGMEGHAK